MNRLSYEKTFFYQKTVSIDVFDSAMTRVPKYIIEVKI